MVRKVIIGLIILIILTSVNIEYLQAIEEPSIFFVNKLEETKKLNQDPCKEGYYNLNAINNQVLALFEMKSWWKVLTEAEGVEVVTTYYTPHGPGGGPGVGVKTYCIPQETFDSKFEPLLKKQAETLDKLVLLFNWAKNIMQRQYSLIDKFISRFWGDPYISEPLETIVNQTNICMELLRSFIGTTKFGDHKFPVSLVRTSRDSYIKGLMEEGLNLGTVKKTWESTYTGPGYGGSGYTVNQYYVFIIDKIKEREGEERYNHLVQAVTNFVKQYEGYIKDIRQASKSMYEAYKGINNEESLDKFINTYQKVDRMIQGYKNNYMVGVREETTCKHLLAGIIKGKTEAGKDVDQIINDILNPQMEAVEEARENLREAIIELKPAEIKVEAVEQPIAVLPPVVFSGEHRGTPTFAQITPETIFNEIRDFLFKLAPTIFILLLVIGAIFYLISPINLQHIQTGSEYIKWAIVGYFLLLVVTGIISAVRVIFGGP